MKATARGFAISMLTLATWMPASAQSLEGVWTGSTSQGHALSFTVLEQSVTSVEFGFDASGGAIPTFNGQVSPPLSITGSAFSGSVGVCYRIEGTFTASTTASGSMSVNGGPVCATLGAISFTWTASLESPPSNDNFLNAIVLGDTQRSVEGSTHGATTESGEPVHHATESATASVWWIWVASASGQVTFDTLGSGFDTILAAYEGGSLTTLEPVVSNDDDLGAETSRVSFMATAGRTYHIVVTGFLEQTGSVRLNWTSIRSIGLEFDLPDRGVSKSASSDGPDLLTGSVTIEPAAGNVAPAGIAIVGIRQNGILVNEAAIPADRPFTNARLYVEVAGAITTGIAIANPNSTLAELSFVVTDSEGATVTEGLTTLSPGEQLARLLNQPPFSVGTLGGGTLTLTASAPVVVTALRLFTNERSELLMTAIPTLDLTLPVGGEDIVVLPHFADGSGWKTHLLLVNPTDGVTAGTISFLEPGTPASPPGPALVELEGNDTYEFSLPPRSGQRIETRGVLPGLRVGSVRIGPAPGSAAPFVSVIFGFQNEGITVSETGAKGESAVALRIYVESEGLPGEVGSIRSGVAIANPTFSPITVDLEITDSKGDLLPLTGLLNLPARGQVAGFLNDLPGFQTLPSPFRGVLRISTTAKEGVVATAIRGRVNERGDFLMATTPPAPETRLGLFGPVYFAHFAAGRGFTTEFILLGTTLEQPSSGFVWFFDPSGTLISPP